MPSPDSSSAATPPGSAPRDPPQAAEHSQLQGDTVNVYSVSPENYLRLDRAAFRRALRQRRLGTLELAKLSNVRLGTIHRCERYGACPEASAGRIARALGTTVEALLASDEEVVLDAELVEAAMRGRSAKELVAASGGTLSSGAVGKARGGAPLRRGLARHLAQVLGVTLEDIVQKESPK